MSEPSKPSGQILAPVLDHVQKGIVGVDQASVQVPDDDSDDVANQPSGES